MKIGLEVHVSLPTESKLFCSCRTYAEEPNTAICPVCTGMPGSKPVLNERALSIAVNIARALMCKVPTATSFVRKVYFYPDLPKSFQITQKDGPVGVDGKLFLEDGKEIRIRRIQLEEDPAKILRQDDYTLIDFNRSGTPLVEIVTEPDILNEKELREFMTELKSILYYLGVDIDRELKADLNISLSDVRVEVKNITGTKNLLDAAKYEIERQEKAIKSKQGIIHETRSYIEKEMSTAPSREKESDEEYGFIFEPDLTIYSTKRTNPVKAVYASKLAKEYANKYKVKEAAMRELILFNRDALALIESSKGKYDMKAIITAIELLQRYVKGKSRTSSETLGKVASLVEKGMYPDKETILQIEAGKDTNLGGNAASTAEIDKEIKQLIKENSALLKEYKKNTKVFNFIVGSVMKKYKANPRLVSERLEKILSSFRQ
ncbi:MAG: Asp-tRNA(Asn)/Glu-tRNA(Gln) amidotransferase subunit GatB [Candidatus Marsarchaeota archaeon]|jgi:aspartyl-tRNA(Asn)/glutamyl-tRNA(Gln) amidotransferase subunit B|nr:Asp-tRNA(Asn)/Glu-tRNA(Gln) amidotransferase subunit GatB [Candidatus Marsarchaeota archaeon]